MIVSAQGIANIAKKLWQFNGKMLHFPLFILHNAKKTLFLQQKICNDGKL